MNTSNVVNIRQIAASPSQGLVPKLMVLTHFIQKSTLEKLVAKPEFGKLSLAYEGYISLLAERDYAPGELAAKLGVSKQLCSKTIAEMEREQLIERHGNPKDKRSSLMSLTAKGLTLLQAGVNATNTLHEQFAAELGAENLKQLIAIVEKLCRLWNIELPVYQHFRLPNSELVSARPNKLNLMLPKINAHLRLALLDALRARGFQGLRSGLGQVMGVISREGKKIQYIASIIGVSKQSIATTATELERLGYIVREQDPNDKRQVILRLSGKGKELLSAAVEDVQAVQDDIQAKLSDSEYLLLEQSLDSLYHLVASHYDAASVLPVRIQQLSKSLIDELGVTGARALAQQLMTLTRGKP